MERPMFISADPSAHRALRPIDAPSSTRRLDAAGGLRMFTFALLALGTFGALGHAAGAAIGFVLGLPEGVTAQCSTASALVASSLAGIGAAFVQLRRTAPTAISDRSHLGCAWTGAPDATIVTAFLCGGAISFVQVLVLAKPTMAWLGDVAPGYAAWHDAPAMLFAFAIIALVPVATELLLRGLLFATLRTTVGLWPAATVVTVAYATANAATIARTPSAVLGVLTVGIVAMALRLRHASLAPAIALHCGANSTMCVVAALG